MEGGLTLDSRSGWVEGGDRGPAIVPGKPAESLLIKAVRREDVDLQMPPEEALSEEQVALLVEWINRGAPDPRKSESVDRGDRATGPIGGRGVRWHGRPWRNERARITTGLTRSTRSYGSNWQPRD